MTEQQIRTPPKGRTSSISPGMMSKTLTSPIATRDRANTKVGGRTSPFQGSSKSKTLLEARSGLSKNSSVSPSKKLPSEAFPLMESVHPKLKYNQITPEDLFDFENKLRDTIQELTKPIYTKIGDMLKKIQTFGFEQEKVSRKVNSHDGAFHKISDWSNTFEDFSKKLHNAENMIEMQVRVVDKKVLDVGGEFIALKKDLARQSEDFRICSRACDNLQKEYCKLVDIVSQERSRNLLYIAKAKNELSKDFHNMEQKLEAIDTLSAEIKATQLSVQRQCNDIDATVDKAKLEFENQVIDIHGQFKHQTNLLTKRVEETFNQNRNLTQDLNKVIKQNHLTDYYLDKVLPISTFTSCLKIARLVCSNQNQLDALNNEQDLFFENLKLQLKSKRLDLSFDEEEEAQKVDLGQEMEEKVSDCLLHQRTPTITDLPFPIGSEQAQSRSGSKVSQHKPSYTVPPSPKAMDSGASAIQKQLAKPKLPRMPNLLLGKDKVANGYRPSVMLKDAEIKVFEDIFKQVEEERSRIENCGTLTSVTLTCDQSKDQRSVSLHKSSFLKTQSDERAVQSDRFESRDRDTDKIDLQTPTANNKESQFKQLQSKQSDSSLNHSNSSHSSSEVDLEDRKLKLQEKQEKLKIAAQEFNRRFSVKNMIFDQVVAFKSLLGRRGDSGETTKPGGPANLTKHTQLQLREVAEGVKVVSPQKHIKNHNNRKMLSTKKKTNALAEPLSIKDKISIQDNNHSMRKTDLDMTKQHRSFGHKVDFKSEDSKSSSYAFGMSSIPQSLGVNSNENAANAVDKDLVLFKFLNEQKKINQMHNKLIEQQLKDRESLQKLKQLEEYQEYADEYAENAEVESSELDSESLKDHIVDNVDIRQHNINDRSSVLTPKSEHSQTFSAQYNQNQANYWQSTINAKTKKSYNRKSTGIKSNIHSVRNGSSTTSKHNMTHSSQDPSFHAFRNKKKVILRGRTMDDNDSNGSRKSRYVRSKFNKRSSVRGLMGGPANNINHQIMLRTKEMQDKLTRKLEDCRVEILDKCQLQVDRIAEENKVKILDEVTQECQMLSKKMDALNDTFGQTKVDFCDVVNNCEDIKNQFLAVRKDYKEQQMMMEVAITRMIRDKRDFIDMYNRNANQGKINFQKLEQIKDFVRKVSILVNQLRTAERIDLSLYAQDEKDRQQTQLYGLDEEMGNLDVKAETPIQVNNNCLQCSGNAQFIKKAFKLACLSYQSSKVKYNDEFYKRDDLIEMRSKMLEEMKELNLDELPAMPQLKIIEENVPVPSPTKTPEKASDANPHATRQSAQTLELGMAYEGFLLKDPSASETAYSFVQKAKSRQKERPQTAQQNLNSIQSKGSGSFSEQDTSQTGQFRKQSTIVPVLGKGNDLLQHYSQSPFSPAQKRLVMKTNFSQIGELLQEQQTETPVASKSRDNTDRGAQLSPHFTQAPPTKSDRSQDKSVISYRNSQPRSGNGPLTPTTANTLKPGHMPSVKNPPNRRVSQTSDQKQVFDKFQNGSIVSNLKTPTKKDSARSATANPKSHTPSARGHQRRNITTLTNTQFRHIQPASPQAIQTLRDESIVSGSFRNNSSIQRNQVFARTAKGQKPYKDQVL